MKFKMDDEETPINWKHVIFVISLFLAPMNLTWNGYYIFGDIFAIFAALTWKDLLGAILGEVNEESSGGSKLFYIVGLFIGIFAIMFIMLKFGIAQDIWHGTR